MIEPETFSVLAGSATCNASCPYCISKMTPKQGISFKKPEVNWRNFSKACRFAQVKKVTNVIITGKGEPTLFPGHVTKFLKELQKFSFPVIELQTNGLVLMSEENQRHLKQWYALGLTIIAISVVHYDKEKNRQIFTPHSDYMNLEKLIGKLHEIGYTVRLSCTLIKGFIDSEKQAEKMIGKAKEWKVEQLSLRSIAVPLESDSKQVYDWARKNRLSKKQYDRIKKFISKKGRKLMTLPHDAVVYDVKGQNVCLTNALTIGPDKEELRQVIFFPDGHLRFDWQFKGAILI